jgi:type VI secretion system protein ImpH
MGAANRPPSATVAEQLAAHPDWFEFVQAVQLLDLLALRNEPDSQRAGQPVGFDHAPQREKVQFRAFPSLAFPGSPIAALERLASTPDNGSSGPVEMVVSFMGLTGPSGVLPQHYTTLLLDQLRDGETALRDFLDLFNHRLISLFYRASTKYRPTLIVAENRIRQLPEDDLFTCVVRSLEGFGTAGHTRRFRFCDDVLLFFAGHFAHAPRNAVSLELMIGSLLHMPATVMQFQGQWLYLNEEDQSRLPGRLDRDGLANQLGVGVIVGERVWSIENRFRMRIGPVAYRQFQRLMPVGDLLRPVCQFARSYAGPEFDCDVQVILKAQEVPACRLEDRMEMRLGWNTWLFSGAYPQDADDVVFQLPDV